MLWFECHDNNAACINCGTINYYKSIYSAVKNKDEKY